MRAKDWMLVYAGSVVRPVLQAGPAHGLEATHRLCPGHRLTAIADGTLAWHADPSDHGVYAGCVSGLTVACTGDAGLDRPSPLDRRFHADARGRTLHLHAMHSVVVG
ncbi:MAG: hypothetical protein QOI35_2401 [Cryptosporangiaceae bacterium]|nr:hypothetical protein [Cryptosporangiaceae bacterium]